MSKGYSLHVALNTVDPEHYDGWDGKLHGCVYDADAMEAIAKSRGYTTRRLIGSQATREAVAEALGELATQLESGDKLLVTYSGHGGSVRDRNRDEDDALDETWCLWNGQLLDDELYLLYGKFSEGVEIVVFSDSCHSGSVTRAPTAKIDPLARVMPLDVIRRVYEKHAAMYDAIQAGIAEDVSTRVKASILLLSGCQDDQVSLDGPFNGAFTTRVIAVWDDGKFEGTYESFHKAIVDKMPVSQTPNLYEVGSGSQKNRAPFAL